MDDWGVAFCTLIVGAAVDSAFLTAFEDVRLELAPDGGGDFSLGDIGHCGVVSPLAPELLFGLEALAASVGAPPCSVGTLAADNARCIAAAEGWVEMGVVRGCGLLSLRIGDVFLDVLGLVPAEVEDVVTSPPDSRFRNGGAAAVVGVVACEDAVLVSLVLRRGAELFAVAMFAASGVSAWPAAAELLPEACSSGLLFAMSWDVRKKKCVCGNPLFAHYTWQQSAMPSGHASCFNGRVRGVGLFVEWSASCACAWPMIEFHVAMPCSTPDPQTQTLQTMVGRRNDKQRRNARRKVSSEWRVCAVRCVVSEWLDAGVRWSRGRQKARWKIRWQGRATRQGAAANPALGS